MAESVDSVQTTNSAGVSGSEPADIAHFFEPKPVGWRKGDAGTRHCTVCLYVKLDSILFSFTDSDGYFISKEAAETRAAGKVWPKSQCYGYSAGSSSSTLRYHLDRFHKVEYLALTEEKGWTTLLPSVKKAIQEAEEAIINSQEALLPRVPFSVEGALDHIVKFIVAHDQASKMYLFFCS